MHVDVGLDLLLLVALKSPHIFHECIGRSDLVIKGVALFAVSHLDDCHRFLGVRADYVLIFIRHTAIINITKDLNQTVPSRSVSWQYSRKI